MAGLSKLEFGNGSEVALAVLRSRKEAVEPESGPEQAKAPAKDWSRHRQAYAEKTLLGYPAIKTA